MSFLKRMYNSVTAPVSNKNPNRVAGGLRAQGADAYTLLGEDGTERQVPTQAYVRTLESQLKSQRATINTLERKVARCEQSIEQLTALIRRA
jgi:hypothetical protein